MKSGAAPGLAVFALAACTLAACSDRTPAQAHAAADISVGTQLAAQQVLGRTLDDAPRSMDPLLVTDVPAQRIMDDLFEGLTVVGIDGRAAPGVASSWETTPDGKTWTFHLRREARWSNREPVTAGDFVYAWRREVDPKTGAEYAQGLAAIVNALDISYGKKPPEALGAEAVDAHTLVVHLNAPTPYLLDLMSQDYLYPVYRPVVERYGDDWVRPEHMVSNGAFVLKEHVIGNRITLDKNPSYWDAAHVQLHRVVYHILVNKDAQAARFLAGEVQFTDSYAANERAWLRSNLGDQVVNSPYYGTYLLGLNFTLPPFKDNLPLRRALVLALDRVALSKYMRFDMYPPAFTLMPPLPGYQQPVPDWAQMPAGMREPLARRLYREAGYSAEHPLRVNLDTATGGPDDRHYYEAVAATWHAVLGADVRVYEREFKVLLQERQLLKLPLFHHAWIGDYPDPYTFMQIFHSGNELNNGGYSNPRFDALVDAAGEQTDNARRYELFEQAERVLNDDAAYVPLYYYATRHLVKPYLKGWQSNIMDRNLSRYMYLLDHQGN